jgi:oligopeptide transport system permease protein
MRGEMLRYILYKLWSVLVTLFLIASLTFVIMKAIPGDPFTEDKALPPEILNALMEHYGLNDPLPLQYVRYLKSIAQFDLGPSFKYPGRTVNDIISDGFPVSAILGLEALLISISFGVCLGSLAATYQNKWQDRMAMVIAIIGISVPSFITATILQYIFSIKLGLFPVARWGTVSHSILPAISLAMLPMAFIARLTRASMLEVMSQDYIRTAKAKGLTSIKILYRHALRNAILPVISYIGPLAAGILTGTFIIERIFGIPGLGQWLVTSISNRDYTIITGITLFYSAILLGAICFVDVLYSWIDPRIKIKDS